MHPRVLLLLAAALVAAGAVWLLSGGEPEQIDADPGVIAEGDTEGPTLRGGRGASVLEAGDAAEVGDSVLEGTVRRAGRPVAGARVELRRISDRVFQELGFRGEDLAPFLWIAVPGAPMATTTTGSDGGYRFGALPPGFLEVTASQGGGAATHVVCAIDANGATARADLNLPAGQHTLVGRATYRSGKPYRGRITADYMTGVAWLGDALQPRPLRVTFHTDAGGRFRVSGLRAGAVTMDPSIFPGGETRGPFRIPSEGPIHVVVNEADHEISGVVRDAETGAPLARARVMSPAGVGLLHEVLTNAKGRFRLRLPGLEDLRIDAEGYAPAALFALTARDIAEPLDIRLHREAVIHGTVRGPGGSGLSGVTVHVEALLEGMPERDVSVRTGAQGQYEVRGLGRGLYVVYARGGGWVSEDLRKTDRDGYNPFVVTVSEDPRVMHDLTVERASRIEGRVLDAEGRPVAGAQVGYLAAADRDDEDAFWWDAGFPAHHWADEEAWAATGPDGRFVLGDLLPGAECHLRVMASGHPPHATRDFEIPPGGATGAPREIRLPAQAWLDVVVRNAETREPIPGAQVQAGRRLEDGYWDMSKDHFTAPRAWTDAGGKARIGPLRSGQKTELAVRASGFVRRAPVDLNAAVLGAPDPYEVLLTPATGRAFHLKVTPAIDFDDEYPTIALFRGKVDIEFKSWNEDEFEDELIHTADIVRVSDEGHYEIHGCPPGVVTVAVSLERDSTHAFGHLYLADGTTDGVIELSIAVDAQSETDAEGTPRPLEIRLPDGRYPRWCEVHELRGEIEKGERLWESDELYLDDDPAKWSLSFQPEDRIAVLVKGDVDRTPRFAPAIYGPFSAGTAPIRIRLRRPRTVQGTVKLASGAPLKGVRIFASVDLGALDGLLPDGLPGKAVRDAGSWAARQAFAVTNAEGRFRLDGLGHLPYALTLHGPAEVAQIRSPLLGHKQTRIDIELAHKVKATLHVRDPSGEPAHDIGFHVGWFDGTTWVETAFAETRKDGTARLEGLDPRRRYVIYACIDYKERRGAFYRTDWTVDQTQIQLADPVSVMLQVEDGAGAPLANGWIKLLTPHGDEWKRISDKGRCELGPLPPGYETTLDVAGHTAGGVSLSWLQTYRVEGKRQTISPPPR